ncbi:hypothetical protein CBR_g48744 [Chara braunii]|uniref:Uncharacterized protein n=1 Tax=Chara braunii TaxID=69332 RepID=A0A388K4M6_CHABU|nr:hypothetical protein CBR_g48744 [Chara braunii]|eukprot:GBG64995.1 hypothetical protein CBR_g48744 [Chara braunii]
MDGDIEGLLRLYFFWGGACLFVAENGREDVMDCATMTAQKMRQRIIEKSELMETEKLFKEAGLDWPPKIPEEEVALAAAVDQDKKKKTRR